MRFREVVGEWDEWARSPRGRRTMATWAERDTALAGWAVDDLRSPLGSARTDAMQASLVALAQQGDAAAAATVTTQLCPGLVALSYGVLGFDRSIGSIEAASAEVLSVFNEVLMRHPLDRRPARIAANLLLDSRQRLWRDATRRSKLVAPMRSSVVEASATTGDFSERVADGVALADTMAQTFDALAGTRRSRQVTAELAYRIWFLDEPSRAVAADLGIADDAARARLSRLRADLRRRLGPDALHPTTLAA